MNGKWIKRAADREANCVVSVGGWVGDAQRAERQTRLWRVVGLIVLALAVFAFFVAPAFSQQPAASTSFVAFPADCNANPPIVFGGKLLAEMDRCAGITVRRALYKSTATQDAVTVAINNVKFVKAVKVKDLVVVNGLVTKVGEKTITVQVSLSRELKGGELEACVDAEFVFCAFDVAAGKAVAHGLSK